MSELVRVLNLGEPEGDVAVDTGGGWRRAEAPSYVAEYVLLGAGGVSLVVGAVFLGVASAQAGVVRDCQQPGVCSAEVAEENADLYAADLMVGQLTMGIGVALLATGGTLLLMRMLDEPEEEDIGDVAWGVTATDELLLGTWQIAW